MRYHAYVDFSFGLQWAKCHGWVKLNTCTFCSYYILISLWNEKPWQGTASKQEVFLFCSISP